MRVSYLRQRLILDMAPRAIVLLVGILSLSGHALAQDKTEKLDLTLPPEFYAIRGLEMSVFYDNVVLTQTPGKYQFTVTCDIGEAGQRSWNVTPTQADVGDHRLTISVADSNGNQVGHATTTLRVAPADAGTAKRLRLLIVGDSLTHASVYPNEIARLLSRPGNPTFQLLGTHKPKAAGHAVAHEGYGGWTWLRFVSQYEKHPDGTHRKRSSPFVFLTADGEPALDVPQYIKRHCDGTPPDVVVFLLGINDCFGADPEDPGAIDKRIDAMLAQADTMLTAFRQAAPDAMLGICLTPPPNAREEGFRANYKDRYHRWGWKRIQHRLVRRQIEHFRGREADRLFIIPTELNIDPVDGYPTNNGVHPNKHGYHQIAASIYAWLKASIRS